MKKIYSQQTVLPPNTKIIQLPVFFCLKLTYSLFYIFADCRIFVVLSSCHLVLDLEQSC